MKINMSHPKNDQWLEAAFENFMDAFDQGDYAMCQDVIGDVADAGFKRESELLDIKLKSEPISRFAVKSPYA